MRRITDLAWPRIVTGIARMSKNAIDVAMVGVAVGSAGIAGVGFAGSFWRLTFVLGAGVGGGTIALVSQSFGADAYKEIGKIVRGSVVLILVLTLPLTIVLFFWATDLLSLISNDPEAIAYGTRYLRIVSLGVPFAALNVVGSRMLVGADDAYTAMLGRGGGALVNIGINSVLIFGLDLGVTGAALGTMLSTVLISVLFTVGLLTGRAPGLGAFPVTISATGTYLNIGLLRQLLSIGLPVLGRRLVWRLAEFPMLAIVDIFGQAVVAAYVIVRRIWGVMNTPGWGFGLASSSLVGQCLGDNDEQTAEIYGWEVIRFAVAVYFVSAVITFVFAEPIVQGFIDDPTSPSVPIAVNLVRAACVATVLQGVSKGAAGPLDASGDTRWTFYSQALGMFGFSIPLVYLGAVTQIGLWGLYLAFVAETAVPAAINYYRFSTGKWKVISRKYGPQATSNDD